MLTIYEQIAELRYLKQISLDDMAKSLDITVDTYIKIEMGESDIKLERLFYIAHYLDVCLSYFFTQRPRTLSAYSNLELLIELNTVMTLERPVYPEPLFIVRKLKELREKQGLSQMVLIQQIDCSRDHYTKIETGTRSPRLNLFFKLAKALNVHPCFLIRHNQYSELDILSELTVRYQSMSLSLQQCEAVAMTT
ncbi:transcriptional regulator (plasmid) [Photobacterium damselae subsp. damselae]|uniref:helix-turn-helix domain-containing protein n=1 Tax=Photobacterium damselae TaxID=38293 RepID=UPI001F26FF90|nr:helix-turn-helix transcriptional regulator [Photobacterium damselae]UJZ96588.1 transcriptional regulator [Photobacterium damselae subsp. damselae]UKA00536.1 transcriptional regulator [Photobacterium damselae subsp. damselae]